MEVSKTKLYRVRQRRWVTLPADRGTKEAWASPDDILCINHPVLAKYIKGQENKLEELNGLPKGCQVMTKLPRRIEREVTAHDRRVDNGAGSVDVPTIARPEKENEDKIAKLEERVDSMKKANATQTAQIADLIKANADLEEKNTALTKSAKAVERALKKEAAAAK